MSEPKIIFTDSVDRHSDFPYSCYMRERGYIIWRLMSESVNLSSIMTAYAAFLGRGDVVVLRRQTHGNPEVVIRSR